VTVVDIAELETAWGDPADRDNPFGHHAVVAADERDDLLAEGERLLDTHRLNAEFVPRALGGELVQADRLMQVMRSVFRRDATLGIGYGITSFIAAVPVWTSGSDEQRAWLAEVLLANRRAAAGYTELAHGADFSRMEVHATPKDGGFVLSGGKQLINNIGRADVVTVFARTDSKPGSRSHSHLLVDLTDGRDGAFRLRPRYRTSGMRATALAGIDFDGCAVPASGLVGQTGSAMETVLKAFQVTRGVLPGIVVGIADTQLRLVTRFTTERRLYSATVADLPHVRSVLANAFVDLLICDSLATVGARSLHVLPSETSVSTAAVKYLVPKMLQEIGYQLSVLLGARSYLREGPYAVFQKNARDLPVATLAHASSAVCQATIIPQLAGLARRSWLRTGPPPADVFRIGQPLPELDFAALGLTASGVDSLSGMLDPDDDAVAGVPELARLRDLFSTELAGLARRCAGIPPRDRTVIASPESFELAHRYAVVLAACACLGVWRHSTEPFLAGPEWIVAALRRLAARLGIGPVDEPAHDHNEPMLAELLARYESGRAFDLATTRLAR
jgi:alkylation response protein AidB-like acyl-CoA dehydrogenase